MATSLSNLQFPASDAITLDDVIAIYEGLRPVMPVPATNGDQRRLDRLIDVLPHVDAMLLDGFGVINVGWQPVDGIHDFLAAAAAQDVAIMVLTNGAGQGADSTWAKYCDWGLDIARDQVVSSRDALEADLARVASGRIVGALGPTSRPLGLEGEETFADEDALFERPDCFAFLGAAGWEESHQARLVSALGKGGRGLLVANPDVSAPLGDIFSAEPGYWAARAMQETGVQPQWYGKPHGLAFDLVLAALETRMGRQFDRRRVAMVGDSLHTDILGASAAGLQSVLVTGYGLFRDGGSDEMISACGIAPDWIVSTL